jgi:SAM-dependent methyltransferase
MRALQRFDNATPSPPRSSSTVAPDALLPEVVARAATCPAERVAGAVLELLEPRPDAAVLELGCGSGRTLAAVAARLREGFVAGIDPSELMVRHAAARNRRAIAQGRAAVFAASTRDLGRFGDARFDGAYGTHVVYFWPEPARDLAEVARVLRPGARLVLGFFAGVEGEPGRVLFPVDRALALLEASGFGHAEALRSAADPRLAFVRAVRTPQPQDPEE